MAVFIAVFKCFVEIATEFKHDLAVSTRKEVLLCEVIDSLALQKDQLSTVVVPTLLAMLICKFTIPEPSLL